MYNDIDIKFERGVKMGKKNSKKIIARIKIKAMLNLK